MSSKPPLVLGAGRVSSSGDSKEIETRGGEHASKPGLPLRPILVPPAATACHECADVPGTQQAVENPTVGTTHETSPTSVDPLPPLCPVRSATRLRLDGAATAGPAFSGYARRTWFLCSSYFRSSKLHQVRAGHSRQRFIGQHFEDAPQILRFQPRFRPQAHPPRRISEGVDKAFVAPATWVPNAVENLGEIRHRVGSIPPPLTTW